MNRQLTATTELLGTLPSQLDAEATRSRERLDRLDAADHAAQRERRLLLGFAAAQLLCLLVLLVLR